MNWRQFGYGLVGGLIVGMLVIMLGLVNGWW